MREELHSKRILLVEDSIQDVEIAKRAFAKGHIVEDLFVVRDGQEAIDYLYRQGKYQDPAVSPRPEMILLDLNLPKVGGIEILRRIKGDPGLRSIPVIILTASPNQEDILRGYDLGANTYIQKPVEFEGFMKVVNAIEEYWMVIASLP